MRGTPIERFKAKYVVLTDLLHNGTPCWIWVANLHAEGYGRFYLNGKRVLAHRFSYEYYRGPIQGGKEPDHLCRRKSCVNPFHLEAVTHIENMRRGDVWNVRTIKSHCPYGHPYSGDNLCIKGGKRRCRECLKARKRESWARLRLRASEKGSPEAQSLEVLEPG